MDKNFFYIIRHGESLGNIGISANPDPPLSPKGRVQAGLCADYLVNEIPTAPQIISSPFQRAIQTAEFIARKFDVKINLEPLLHEFYTETIFPKNYKHQSLRTIADSNPMIVGNYSDDTFLPAKFETRDELKLRTVILRNSLMKMISTIESLVDAMCKVTLSQIPNCSVTKIRCVNNTFNLEYSSKNDFIPIP